MGVKNFWSLNVSEALVADKIKTKLGKEYMVFFPIKANLKDIDLVLMNLVKGSTKTIQVKSSRAHVPLKYEASRYGEGSTGWIQISKKCISDSTYKIDYFILVSHSIYNDGKRLKIDVHYFVIPSSDLKDIVSRKKLLKSGGYDFFLWMDRQGKRYFDFNVKDKSKTIDLKPYLEKWESLE